MVEWRVHSERRIYESPWVSLALTTVEPPGIEPFEHHVVRAPRPAAGCVITRWVDNASSTPQMDVLLIHRHRFITDTWGWEIPAGAVDDGETSEEAARREAREETGWAVDAIVPLTTFHPSNGLSDQTFHIFHATQAEHVGDPTDPTEASTIAWRSADEVRRLIAQGEVTDGLSLTALSVGFALGVLIPNSSAIN